MNVSASPAPTSLFSFKLTAVLVGIVVSVLTGAFFLATGPLFGTPYMLLAFGTPALILVVFATLFAKANADANRPAETAFFVAAFTALGFTVLLASTSRFQDSRLAEHAVSVVERAGVNLGHPVASEAAVRAAAASRQSTANNRVFLQTISKGRVAKDSVTQYLVNAKSLGVDASFVVKNAIVRPQDDQALFQTAIKKAQAGDKFAAQWLLANPVDTR